jgi:hypothetical protein
MLPENRRVAVPFTGPRLQSRMQFPLPLFEMITQNFARAQVLPQVAPKANNGVIV